MKVIIRDHESEAALWVADRIANAIKAKAKISDKPFVLKEKLYVYYVAGRTAASNVQLMASVTPTDQVNNMTRNGYEMMPYINDFVPAEVSVLYPYMELYNVEKEVGDNPYHVAIHIEQSFSPL